MTSIRQRLLLSLLLLIFSGIGLTAYKVSKDLRKEINTLFDEELVVAAHTVPRNTGGGSGVGECGGDLQRQVVTFVWHRDSAEPVYRSCRGIAITAPRALGFSTETIDGQEWRTYVSVTADSVVKVGQPVSVRSSALGRVTLALSPHVFLLLPIIAVIVWYVVSSGLRPLTRLATELKHRSPTALQGISPEDLPRELAAVVTALNQLMSRLDLALVTQRRFVDDAAHEILTPLTALQVQLQVLERARTEERRRQAVEDIRVSLERCVNLARQLLSLARSSSETPQTAFGPVDLTAVAHHAVQEALPKAQARKIDVGLEASQSATVYGDKLALRVMLRNLVDNAIKYSDVGGQVDVAILSGDTPELVVSDAGPGVSADERARLFDRFYRGSNPDVEGSGLGLAIVREIAARHSAEVQLRSPGRLGGLDVVVRFGPNAGKTPSSGGADTISSL